MSIAQQCFTFCNGDKDCMDERCIENQPPLAAPSDSNQSEQRCEMIPTVYNSPAHAVTVKATTMNQDTAFFTCLNDSECKFVAVSHETIQPTYMIITDAQITQDMDLPSCIENYSDACKITIDETYGNMFDKKC